MIIGDKTQFAIETSLSSCGNGDVPLGNICLWINSERIGEFDDISPVGVTAGVLESLVHDMDLIFCNSLFVKEPKNRIVFLRDTLFASDNDELDIATYNAQKYGPFVLGPSFGESFDDYFLCIVEWFYSINTVKH